MEHSITIAKYGIHFAELNAEKFPIKCDLQFINAMDTDVENAVFPTDMQI